MENRPGTVGELTSLYRDIIVRHAAAPVGFDAEIDATHVCEVFNPLCGDRIEMRLKIVNQQIEAIAFRGEACAICLASASLLCEHQSGSTTDEFHEAHSWLAGSLSGELGNTELEPLKPLLGVKAYPSRVRCALLPWEAADKAIRG